MHIRVTINPAELDPATLADELAVAVDGDGWSLESLTIVDTAGVVLFDDVAAD